MPSPAPRPSALLAIATATVILLLLAAGSWYVYFVWRDTNTSLRKGSLALAEAAASLISREDLLALAVDSSDLSKAEYARIKEGLARLKDISREAAFTYLMVEIDGLFFFMADSEPEGSDGYSPPGQQYLDMTVANLVPFREGLPILTDPEMDSWGTWVSALIPIKDNQTGSTIAVLGIDYEASSWRSIIDREVLTAVIAASSMLLLLIALYSLSLRTISLNEIGKKLTESEELFRAVFVEAPIGIAAIDDFDRLSMVNPMFERITGRKAEELKSLDWGELTHPSDSEAYTGLMARFRGGGLDHFSMDKRIVKPDGSSLWISMSVKRFALGSEKDKMHLLIIRSIEEQQKATEALQESERSKSVLLSNLPGMAYRCDYDKDWTMRYISSGCFKLTGYRPKSLIGNAELSYNDVVAPEYRQELWEEWKRVIARKIPFRYEYEIITAKGDRKWVYEQGQPIFGKDGEIVALEGLIIDIADRKRREDEVSYLNERDYITGLYNRRYFEKMRRTLNNSGSLPISVIIGDINGLKFINDSLGHAEGDMLIMETAKLLKSVLRPKDMLARTGGDEFAILMPETGEADAVKLMEEISKAVDAHNRGFLKDSFHISIALGSATKKHAEEDLDRMLRSAEDAMYEAKLANHRQSYKNLIESIRSKVFSRSHETPEHAERISELAVRLGLKLGVSESELADLTLAAALHDIGNISIDSTIFSKQGDLTEDEWAEVKRHPLIGHRIANASEELEGVSKFILCHHERWDGKGYPNGIAGEDIPLLSRILAVADAYDAMTQDRPHRKAMLHEDAMKLILAESGAQFDPKVVAALCDIVKPLDHGRARIHGTPSQTRNGQSGDEGA